MLRALRLVPPLQKGAEGDLSVAQMQRSGILEVSIAPCNPGFHCIPSGIYLATPTYRAIYAKAYIPSRY